MGMLDGKVAFITGAASGIGAETARRFAQEGAKVALTDVLSDHGPALLDELEADGHEALYVDCDVRQPREVEQAVGATVSHFGKLDVVFANAGINGVMAPIEDLQPREWDDTLAINLTGTYLTVHYAVPHLKRAGGGSIIVTGSVNGTRSFSMPGASAYSASKAAQVAFTKMIALELGQYNIRCNAICPGYVPTDIAQRTQQRHIEEIGIEVKLPRGSPALGGGSGDVTQVADVCLFLASDLSRHVSGVELFVDGGASLLH